MFDAIQGTVKQYPYRTATVGEVFLTLPRDTVKALESHLAEVSGSRVDNHVVYEIQQPGGTTYISFSDFSAYFGLKINERSW